MNSACSTASSPGGSTTAATPMLRTGSTSSPGPTSSFDHATPRRWHLPADQPVSRADANSLVAHAQLLAKASRAASTSTSKAIPSRGAGDATDYPELLANWKQNFFGWNAADFGWGADRTQNILWRLQNGELDGVNPKVIVLLAGTNNVGDRAAPGSDEAKAGDITRGVQAILRVLQEKAPAATIIVMGIFPRNDNPAFMPIIDKINHKLSEAADGKKIRYLNINEKLADHNGMLFDGMMNPDKLHPTVKAYQVWADALKPSSPNCWGLLRLRITPRRRRVIPSRTTKRSPRASPARPQGAIRA